MNTSFSRFSRFVCLALLPLSAPCIRAQTSGTQKPATIYGTICDSNNQPVSRVELRLESADGRKAGAVQSDASGHFQFDAVTQGTYTLRAKREGYQEGSEGPFVIRADETKNIVLHLARVEGAAAADASAAIPFSDEPQFTVAGVTDTTALGVHASTRAAPNSATMARETAALAHEEDHGVSPQPTSSSEVSMEAIRAKLAAGESPDLRFQLAEAEEREGHALQAERDYERAAELAPTEPHLFGLGAELLLHRAMEPAIEIFRKGHARYPASVRMLLGLGASYYAQGSRDEAAQYFLQASDLEPLNPQPYLFLGRLLASENVTPPGWTKRMERFAVLHPETATAHYLYGLALAKQGQPGSAAEAEAQFDKALELDAHCGDAYLQLGVLRLDRKDFAGALAVLQKAVESSPLPDAAHYRLAEVYRHLGEPNKARQEMALYKQIEEQRAVDAERERHEIQQFIYTLRGATAPAQTPTPQP